MIEVFEIFGRLLEDRFRLDVITTEDSVRYTFFAALLNSGVKPEHVVLEFPHPEIERAKIDTWLPEYGGSAVAVEFKFDRDPPGGKNQPKTQKAGAVFKDFRRQALLTKLTGVRSFFVYVTSQEMAVYFRNPSNGHTKLWELEKDSVMEIDTEYLAGKPKTFIKTFGDQFEAKIIGAFQADLSGGNYIRAYEIV
ncbi:MAG: hypothetical protein AAF434_01565 [Pseudomonadota bacterium]